MKQSKVPSLPPAVLRDATLASESLPLVQGRELGKGEPSPKGFGGRLESSPQEPSPAGLPQATPSDNEVAIQKGYDDGLKEGREQGYRAGFDKGLAEGRKAGQDAVSQETEATRQAGVYQVDRLSQLVDAFQAQIDDRLSTLIHAAEDEMVVLCHAVICRLLGDHFLDRKTIIHVVEQAVEQYRRTSGHSAVTGLMAIRMHPADLETLRGSEELNRWLNREEESRRGIISWVPDAQVGLGGCIVSSNQGSLDRRLETQLASLRDVLTQKRVMRDPVGGGKPTLSEPTDESKRMSG